MSDKPIKIAERWKTAYEVWSRKDMQGHEVVTSTAVQLIKELSAAEAKLPCGHHVSMEQEVNDQKYCDFCYRLDCLQKAEARMRELEKDRDVADGFLNVERENHKVSIEEWRKCEQENASLREQVSRLEQWIARTTHGSEQKKRSNHAERMDLDQ